MKKLKAFFCHSPLKYLLLLVIGMVIWLLYAIINGFCSLFNHVCGLQVAGMVIVLTGGLSCVSYYGAFDLFSYNLYRFSKDKKKREKYGSLFEYSEIKKEERKTANPPYSPYFVVGIFYILVAFFLDMF